MACRADNQFFRSYVVEGLHRRVCAREAVIGLSIHAANERERTRVELHKLTLAQGALGQRLRISAGDDGAILGRSVGEKGDRDLAACARHVLRNDVGLARQVAPDMSRKKTGVGIVTARRRRRDQDRQILALVEVLRVGGACRARRKPRDHSQRPQSR